MKIFVLGGTGLVGRYLVKRLLNLGHTVHVRTRDAGKVDPCNLIHISLIWDFGESDRMDKNVDILDKDLAYRILKPLYTNFIRKLLQSLGLRCPIYFPDNKLLIFENKAILSSLKAEKDFFFKPTKTFRDVCNQICMGKISNSKELPC